MAIFLFRTFITRLAKIVPEIQNRTKGFQIIKQIPISYLFEYIYEKL